MTTLSVIVPMHNVALFARDLLASLTRNSREDFEFIFVDDGSDDLTAEILEAYRTRLPGFTVVRHARAQGPSKARNSGLAAASGRLVTYVDGDDWLAPGYLPKAVAAIDALGCDFIKTDHIQAFGRRRELHRAPQGLRGTVLKPRDGVLPHHDATMVDYPNAWSGVYRRELVDDGLLTFDEELVTCEDRHWTWRLHRHARSYAVVSLVGVFYRRKVENSLTAVGDERQLHFFDAFDKILLELDDDPDRDRFRRKALRTYLALMAFHYERAERLTEALRQELVVRARKTITELPSDEWAELLPGFGPPRAALLRELAGLEVAAR